MAVGMQAKNSVVLSSVLLQLVFYITGVYYIFYFLSSVSLIIYKSYVLSYPNGNIAVDLFLLIVMAVLEGLRLYWGTCGNLTESEGYISMTLGSTVGSVMLAVYFLVWQSYVLRADVIINAILLAGYGLNGLLGFFTFAHFSSVYT
ncbi:transmembrane protein 80 [Clupea harengus]|uniref:Transmembrane protein 80 n=1 Tax=Clupea harengus TaxID=7950 RepID=A0A6P8F951_CLUHA|nr:transmembrane protein 80 [Clupea harengus]